MNIVRGEAGSPLKKKDWSGMIYFPMTVSNLLAKTLENMFRSEFIKGIGLMTFLGLSSARINLSQQGTITMWTNLISDMKDLLTA